MRRTGKLKLCAYLSCWSGQGWKLHWRAWQPGLISEDRDKNPSSWLLSPVERALAIVGRGAWRLGKVARRSPKNVNWLIKDVNIKDKVNKWERVNEPSRAAALLNSSFNSKIAFGWILSFLLVVNTLYYEWQQKNDIRVCFSPDRDRPLDWGLWLLLLYWSVDRAHPATSLLFNKLSS